MKTAELEKLVHRIFEALDKARNDLENQIIYDRNNNDITNYLKKQLGELDKIFSSSQDSTESFSYFQRFSQQVSLYMMMNIHPDDNPLTFIKEMRELIEDLTRYSAKCAPAEENNSQLSDPYGHEKPERKHSFRP